MKTPSEVGIKNHYTISPMAVGLSHAWQSGRILPMNIREITENEREQLYQLTSCSDEAVAKRARAVFMASEGIGSTSIAQSLKTSERTVRYAVKRFNDGGAEALERRVSPGRTRSVSDSGRQSLGVRPSIAMWAIEK